MTKAAFQKDRANTRMRPVVWFTRLRAVEFGHCPVYEGRIENPETSQSKKLDGSVVSPTPRPEAPWIQKKLESESVGR